MAIITPMLKRQQSSFLSAWAIGSITYMAGTVLNSVNLPSWSFIDEETEIQKN